MAGLSGRRVLVVEDETLVAMTIEDMLADLGLVVAASVTSVGAAVTAIADHAIDCAILDINLDGERVFPVAEVLRTRAIPFVFSTGYGTYGLREDFRDVAVLTKPYRRADLERALLRLWP